MRVLVIGNGGREHALAWKLTQSKRVKHIWVAPGNAGTEQEPKVENLNIAAMNVEALVDFADQHHIDLTIVGPEAPLAAGIVDAFQAKNLRCLGPTQAAAKLESSKIFSKDFMQHHGIPTARHTCFHHLPEALDHLETQRFPLVIKRDGLASGKGVIIATDLHEAKEAVIQLMNQPSTDPSNPSLVIEEFIEGIELSYMVICDGKHMIPLASSQDHKRRDDGDKGPNTGGMGAYSPAPYLTSELEAEILRTIIEPTIQAMHKAGTPYTGFLYAGLMITPEGTPMVLEFNCRLGDPEAEPLLMRLDSDFAELCLAATQGQLSEIKITWKKQAALGVVLCSAGYPGAHQPGEWIEGLERPTDPLCKIFHAGTSTQKGGLVTEGGRVLCVCALGENILAAQQRAYAHAKQIYWPGCFYRQDIGYQALQQ